MAAPSGRRIIAESALRDAADWWRPVVGIGFRPGLARQQLLNRRERSARPLLAGS